MTLPDPHLPLNPGHVMDDPPAEDAKTPNEIPDDAPTEAPDDEARDQRPAD